MISKHMLLQSLLVLPIFTTLSCLAEDVFVRSTHVSLFLLT